jgi:protein O-GlcNAc transferase
MPTVNNPPSINDMMAQAVTHHEAKRLPQAEALYRQILGRDPNNPDALHRLGLIAFHTGHTNDALALISQAIRIQPNVAEYHCNIGAVLSQTGKPNEAAAAFQQSLKIKPGLIDALINLGNLYQVAGKHREAIAYYRRAMVINPQNFLVLLGLGSSLKLIGDVPGAVAALTAATRIRPDVAEAHTNLADAQTELGLLKESIDSSRRALSIKPDLAEAHNNLGRAYLKSHQIPGAIEEFRRALAIKPTLFESHNNLGSLLKDIGDLDEAIVCYDRAMALRPDQTPVDSNRVYTLVFHPGYDAAAILREHKVWNQRHAVPLRSQIKPHTNDRDPNRRLRIGYVSPDFREHVVGRNMVPLLREHDRKQFEVFCYANHFADDEMTARIRPYADQWRHIVAINDEQACELIRRDKIDILVDLSLHMAYNRMLIFARKPAPIQVTFGGYPGGTGQETIDYRLSDPYLDPEGADEFYVEKTIRLPHSFWCYDTEGMGLDQAPAVNELPALSRGHITFGCLNNLCKINDTTLTLWKQVLDAVPGSRIMVLTPMGNHRQRLADRLDNRADCAEWLPRMGYLQRYNNIDLGLDTIPYNGHSTSLDSLWMGVPVVSLLGRTVVGRAGWSQLSNLKLTELVAETSEDYIKLAASWATDLPRLAELRRTLRERMKASPLMDARGFARGIEAEYRKMWKTWVNQ